MKHIGGPGKFEERRGQFQRLLDDCDKVSTAALNIKHTLGPMSGPEQTAVAIRALADALISFSDGLHSIAIYSPEQEGR